MSKRTVASWRREVFRSPISANVRLLLIYMSDYMREHDKHVSIPRKQMAKALGWSEARVSERLGQAVAVGLLYSKTPGYRGHTAEYQGTWPDAPITKSVRKNRTQSQDQKTGRFLPPMRPEDTDATSRADRFSDPTRRDVGSDKKAKDHPVRSHLTACAMHGWDGCPQWCHELPGSREVS